jgi:hypothetical protein
MSKHDGIYEISGSFMARPTNKKVKTTIGRYALSGVYIHPTVDPMNNPKPEVIRDYHYYHGVANKPANNSSFNSAGTVLTSSIDYNQGATILEFEQPNYEVNRLNTLQSGTTDLELLQQNQLIINGNFEAYQTGALPGLAIVRIAFAPAVQNTDYVWIGGGGGGVNSYAASGSITVVSHDATKPQNSKDKFLRMTNSKSGSVNVLQLYQFFTQANQVTVSFYWRISASDDVYTGASTNWFISNIDNTFPGFNGTPSGNPKVWNYYSTSYTGVDGFTDLIRFDVITSGSVTASLDIDNVSAAGYVNKSISGRKPGPTPTYWVYPTYCVNKVYVGTAKNFYSKKSKTYLSGNAAVSMTFSDIYYPVDTGYNWIQNQSGSRYGETIGITDSASYNPNSVAVFTRISPSSTLGISLDKISGTYPPSWFLTTNGYKTPYIPISSATLSSVIDAEQVDRQAANDIFASTTELRTTVPGANDMNSLLNRDQSSQTALQRWEASIAQQAAATGTSTQVGPFLIG